MTEKLKRVTKEEIMKLSKEVQEAISAFDWASVSEEIGKKFKLSESDLNNFQVETLLVLIGLEDGNSYSINIEEEVGTSKEEALKIADEVFQKIFTPVSNQIEEKIKKNLQNKRLNHEQNLNFILTGGDYSTFVEGNNT